MGKDYDTDTVAAFECKTWSRCAGSYMDGFGVLTAEAIEPLLSEVKAGVGDRVADVGTGPGLLAAAASARGAEVVAVDFSEAMLSEARTLFPHLDFRNASAESLPFEDETFEAVAGNFVLHHSAKPESVLAEAHRVLRPGGRMGFTVWGDPSELMAFGVFFSAVEEHAGAAELPHGPLFGISDFAVFHRIAQQAGFRDPAVRSLDLVWRTPSLEPYLGSFRDWADLSGAPPALRDAIEGTVRERAEAYRLSGAYSLPNPAILVSGVK